MTVWMGLNFPSLTALNSIISDFVNTNNFIVTRRAIIINPNYVIFKLKIEHEQ